MTNVRVCVHHHRLRHHHHHRYRLILDSKIIIIIINVNATYYNLLYYYIHYNACMLTSRSVFSTGESCCREIKLRALRRRRRPHVARVYHIMLLLQTHARIIYTGRWWVCLLHYSSRIPFPERARDRGTINNSVQNGFANTWRLMKGVGCLMTLLGSCARTYS